jgi:hypothetical protein
MSVCAKCGFDNPPDARFCGECGNTLPSEAPPPEAPAPRPELAPSPVTGAPAAPQPAAVDSGLKVGIIIGTVFVPLLGIIMGIIYMNDRSPEKKKVGRLWLMVGIGMFALYLACVCVSMAQQGYHS